MFARNAEVIDLSGDGAALEAAFEYLPKGPAVFAIWPASGEPYLGKTNVLSRRLKRLIRGATFDNPPSHRTFRSDHLIAMDYSLIAALSYGLFPDNCRL